MDRERVFHIFSLNIAALINRDAHRAPSHKRKELIDEAMQYALEAVATYEKVVGDKDIGEEDA
ncbi:hypothetical protein EB118_04200 [bacterium]|nr:hypothetical protein [bacterium]